MVRYLVPRLGFLAVITLAITLIGVIVLRNPDTHANLWMSLKPGYTRTSPILVGQEVGVQLPLNPDYLKRVVPGSMDPGRAIYLSRGCSTCHGLDARGGPVGPPLAGSSLEVVKRMVWEGRKGMLAYDEAHVSDADLALLTTYLQGLAVARPNSEEVAALKHITYDPSVPVGVLLQGKGIIRRSCGVCHAQPGKEDFLQAFSSDDQAAGLLAQMVQNANVSVKDGMAIIYYVLAVLHDADPIKAP